MLFVLGLILGAVRGFGPGYGLLMSLRIVLFVVVLFWEDKASAWTGDRAGTAGFEPLGATPQTSEMNPAPLSL